MALSQKVFGYLGWPKTWILPGIVADDLRYTRTFFGSFFQVIFLLVLLQRNPVIQDESLIQRSCNHKAR